MTRWRYSSEPLLCAETLWADGKWHRDDQLFKRMMLGSSSHYNEVDEARFAESLAKRPAEHRSTKINRAPGRSVRSRATAERGGGKRHALPDHRAPSLPDGTAGAGS